MGESGTSSVKVAFHSTVTIFGDCRLDGGGGGGGAWAKYCEYLGMVAVTVSSAVILRRSESLGVPLLTLLEDVSDALSVALVE